MFLFLSIPEAAVLFDLPILLAATEAADLGSKVTIVIVCNIIFFGLIASIAVVAKFFPAWEKNQIERQRALRQERVAHREKD